MEPFAKLVDAVNYLNKYTPQFVADVKKQLDPYIGKPIYKADGSLRKAVNFTAPQLKTQLPNGDWLAVYCHIKPFCDMVDLEITVCLNGGSYNVKPSTAFCIYERNSVSLYSISRETGNIDEAAVYLAQYMKEFNAEHLEKWADDLKAQAKKLENELNQFPARFRDALSVPRLS